MSPSGDRLRRIAQRAENEGGKAAAEAMADAAASEMRTLLGLRSHPPRTSTPAPLNNPPAKISGRLQRSIFAGGAIRVGAGRWSAAAGSQGLIYARVQEKGMTIHRRNAPWLTWISDGRRLFAPQVTIPARSFVARGAEWARDAGRTEQASAEAFRRAVHGG